MIPRQPEPPAIPGVIPSPPGPIRRACQLARRYWWEALPAYVAIPIGTAIELHAATNPDWETPLFYSASATTLATAAYLARTHKPSAFGLGSAAGACAWATAVTAGAPTVPALIVGTAATIGASTQYWRLLGKTRADHRAVERQQAHDVEMAQLAVMKAYAGAARIPGQREAPTLESTTGHGDLPTVEWPGARPGLSIADPIPLSDHTSITLPGGHVLIGGGTDAGKSNLVHVIASTVITRRNARLLGIDMKPGAVELGIYRKAGARIASSKRDALDLLHWVRDEGIRRGEAMGATIHDDGTLTRSWTATEADPHLVLVIDELAELVDADAEAAKILKSHTRLLRAMGITVLAATQSPSRHVFGGDTDGRGQYGTRICVATYEPTQTNLILGQGAHGSGWRADQLDGRGSFLIQSRQHRDPEPDRAYLMTDRALAQHANNWALTVPAHRDAEPEAFDEPAEPAFETTGTTTGDILKYLAEHTGTPAEVAAATSRNKDSVRALMSKLTRDGHLISLGDGRYRAAKSGAAIAGNVIQIAGRRKA